MPSVPVVAAVGCTEIASERRDCNARDLLTDALLDLLADAGMDGLGAVEHGLASYESDHFNMQMTLGAILHDTIGMTPKPSLRVEGGGATGALALRTAWAHIQSGLCDSVLVYGVEKNGRGVSSQTANQLFALSADVDWETAIGGTYTSFYAAMMRAHMAQYGTREEHFAHVAARNRANAAFNPIAQKPMDISIDDVLRSRPVADPYKLLDCSLLSDGAACLLLASEAWAREHVPTFRTRPPVFFTGTGCGTDTMRLGDRHPHITNFRAKQQAAQAAYAMAGIRDPLREIDVAELYDSYSGVEIQAVEDLGWVGRGEGGKTVAAGAFDLDGILPVNPSGGLLGRGAPVGATGILQAIEVTQQLWGLVDERRQVPGAKRGLADTHAGIASISVVNIFERRD
ncbi:MAG: thiolase domain-containing protein [Chloroflexi bacterium]|nr:thiolase domain-containing protein [Chloroflexota bacterium]MCY4248453.1 thiolase domain-containing protein [Chloroflexota bacterium]